MRYIYVQNGTVRDVRVANLIRYAGWIEHETAQVGDSYVDGVLTPRQPTADELRIAAIDAEIAADSTISSLKEMSNTQFDAWWSANVTTAAQAINVLKRIARVVIRRVL